MSRRAELEAGLAAVRERIVTACAEAGREPGELTLIVVTKTYPASDVRELAGLGVHDVGENRDQEAAPKAAETGGLDLRRHFIGQLQSNKARSVAAYADVVHSVDRGSLVTALDKAAGRAGRRLGCCVQVGLDASGGRGGVQPRGVPELADRIAGAEHLDLHGLMAVAPLDADPDPAFAALRDLSDRLRADHPGATWISAGMSGDLESAIRNGATHLRVGSAVLGERPPLGYRPTQGYE